MNKKNKVLNFLNSHRIIITIILMVLALGLVMLPQVILKLPMVNKEVTDGITLILTCSQIVSAIFVIAGTIVAVWQYYLSSTKRLKEVEFSRVEKAIELSNYYKDNILDRYSFVKRVFDAFGLTAILEEKRKNCEPKEFDVLELKQLYSSKEIELFDGILENKGFLDCVIGISAECNVDIKGVYEGS